MVVISIPTTISTGESSTTTLATCLDTKSTILLEFQGIIEMDGATWAGNALGQLSVLDGGVKAQLVIGNHRLEGKVVKLDKPLLLIQKQKKPRDNNDQDKVHDRSSNDKGKSRKDHDDRSPFTSMPPASPTKIDDDDDTMASTTWGDDPTNPSSAADGNVAAVPKDPLDPLNIRETVQYDTVAIIRQKILFNTMPVPIIHSERRGLTSIKRGV
ncbi:hypothetical protein BGZ79_000772 [Entomortierella chlamydospora]|nr:hypothetical protein BGZ79_000772 [Entomortierella chlamydospora]